MVSLRKDIHNSDVPQVCVSCEARHRGVCGALSEEQLIKLSKTTTRSRVGAETELLHLEEKVDRFSNIIRGVVKLSKLLPDGRQQIVGLQFAPDFLGRPFAPESQVTAEASGPVSLCSFPRSVLEELINEAPELEQKLHQQSLRELDEARDLMMLLGRKSASEKVASFLLLLIEHIDPEGDGPADGFVFELPLKRADMADFLGLTIETVSRQLTKLRRSGVIAIENNRIVTVLSLSRLKAATGSF